MSALGSAVSIVLEKVRARSLAASLANATPSERPVAVYFADAPSSLYQLRRWYRTLEALDATRPVVIITSVPATYEVVRRETSVEVTFATGAPQLARAFARYGVRVILYPNHNALNFRVLRFARPAHVFIGHGESAKESSFSRQLKAYDFAFVADEGSLVKLREVRGFDLAAAVITGSPWLDFVAGPPASWVPDGRTVVLYAPTWEGDRPTMDYSSVESVGEEIVAAILGDPGLRIIYRPHPWLGRVRDASARADQRIRSQITRAGNGGIVDVGEYGWVLGAADVCVTDVSSVAHDWRASVKPLFVFEPAVALDGDVLLGAFRDAERLSASDAGGVAARIRPVVGENRATDQPKHFDGFVAGIDRALHYSDTDGE